MTRKSVPWLVGLLTLSVLLNYVDRGAVGIAAPLMKKELHLSATEFGLAVSAFFWIYAPIQLILGWLCDRFNVYRLFALGLAIWAASTLATAFVGGLVALVLLRILLGIGESIAFPGSSKIIAAEVAPSNRGIVNALIAAAIAFGPAVGTLAGGVLLESHGWRSIFLVFGLATFFWLIPWAFVSRPFKAAPAAAEMHRPPIGQLLRVPMLWWSGIAQFCTNYAFYFILAWLPLFLVSTRGMSITNMTMLTTAFFVVQGVSALGFGWLSDHLVRGGMAEGHLRRRLLAAAQFTTAVAIVGVAYAGSNQAIGWWLMPAAVATGVLSTNIYCVAQIFAGPKMSGSWVGIQNGLGNASGIVGPVITGLIIDYTGSYHWAFLSAAAVAACGGLIWLTIIRKVEPITLD